MPPGQPIEGFFQEYAKLGNGKVDILSLASGPGRDIMVGAHFPVIKKIDDFDFGRVKGIGKSEAINLLDCRWIDNQENLLFFGPPGVGANGRIKYPKISQTK